MSTPAPPKQLTGRTVLLLLVAFFGVVIAANVTMMRLAITTLPGVEVDSAYSASLGYEQEIAAAREQAARRWRVDAHVERSGDGAAVVKVEARDSAGRPITGVKFAASFERPADKRADRAVTFEEVGVGVYRGRVETMAAGQWDLVLEGDSAAGRMFLSKNRVLLH